MLLDSRQNPDANYDLSRVAYWMPNRNTANKTKLNEFIVGAEGNVLKSDWTWEAYSSYGETTLLTTMENFIWLDRYQALLLQPNFGQGGSIVARAANIGVEQTFTCTSGLPLFEPWILGPHGEVNYYNDFQLSDDCARAITARMSQSNVVEQRVTEANVQGKLADMRAGELRAAFGVSTRMNRSAFEPDALFLATAPAAGQTDVDEIYGEILLPVTSKFELEFGARYSDFTTGDFALDAKSYKTLFSWSPTDALRFRGGWQRANRTPNVAELYSGPTSQGFTWTAGDACRADTTHPWGNLPSNPNRAQVQQLCAELLYKEGATPGNNRFDVDRNNFPFDGGSTANVHLLEVIGNPRLGAESADTYTLGMVWQSSDRDLNFSADLYQIDITNVVGSLGFLTAYEQCFNVNGVSNPSYSVANPYCQAIRRDPDTGNAGTVQGGSFNLSERYTSGLDLSVNWRKEMLGGEFGITSSVNKLFTWKQPATADPGSPLLEYAGYGDDFEYRLFTQFSYSRDALSVGLNWRYLPQSINVARVQTPSLATADTAAYHLFNLNGSWQFAPNLRLRGGIDNIADKQPPRVGTNLVGNNPTNAMGVTNSNYDVLGRRYYVGLAVSF
jgi:iron complex outermembrane receptor protein